MFPDIVTLGPITIHSFGVMLAAAFLLCGHLHAKELQRRGLDPDLASTAVTWGVVGGLVGARLYYLVENWGSVRGDLLGSIFSGSGLVAYGGFLGGVLFTWLALRRRKAPVLAVTDAAAPLLALGYAIGRLGCLLAGDGDYGPPSGLPWAMAFPRGVIPTDVPVHPTPLYETLLMLAVFAVLWQLRLRPWPTGRLFALYLVLQGAERFAAEIWRMNRVVALGLTAAQLIALATVVVGSVWLALSRAGSAHDGEPRPLSSGQPGGCR